MANSRISDLSKITDLSAGVSVGGVSPTLEEKQQGSGMFLVANKKLGNEHMEYRDLKSSITDHSVFTTGEQSISGPKTFTDMVSFAGGYDLDAGDAADINSDTLTTDYISAKGISGRDDLYVRADELFLSGSYVTASGDGAFKMSDFKTGQFDTTKALNLNSDKLGLYAATQVNISSPIVTISEDVFIKGDLFVSGETVTFDVGTLSVEDKTIELSSSTTGVGGMEVPTSDVTADGAGIIVSSDGGGDKTWIWEYNELSANVNPAWTSNQSIAITGAGSHLLIKQPAAPIASNDSAGDIGEITWDDNFLYIKTNNGWRRSVLAQW